MGAALGFPTILPASIFGQYAPSKRINIGAIGTGRISRGHDMPGILQYGNARIMAVCDLDAHRVEEAKKFVNDYYTEKSGKPYDGVIGYSNYHDLLANKDIDAVVISTPDHWHALIGIDAVKAGKDVYLQKPASLTIAEGRALSMQFSHRGASCKSGASNVRQFSFATRRSWCGTVESAICSVLKLDYPEIPLAGERRPWPYRTVSITRCGSGKRPTSSTRWIAFTRGRGTTGRDGCVAASSAPA
jgi:hypothetical protein